MSCLPHGSALVVSAANPGAETMAAEESGRLAAQTQQTAQQMTCGACSAENNLDSVRAHFARAGMHIKVSQAPSAISRLNSPAAQNSHAAVVEAASVQRLASAVATMVDEEREARDAFHTRLIQTVGSLLPATGESNDLLSRQPGAQTADEPNGADCSRLDYSTIGGRDRGPLTEPRPPLSPGRCAATTASPDFACNAATAATHTDNGLSTGNVQAAEPAGGDAAHIGNDRENNLTSLRPSQEQASASGKVSPHGQQPPTQAPSKADPVHHKSAAEIIELQDG